MIKTSLFVIMFTILHISAICQTKSSTSELNKIASNLIECYFLLKATSLTNYTECTNENRLRLSGLSALLWEKVTENKISVIQKIGAADFNKLQSFIKSCNETSENLEPIMNERQRLSVTIWLKLWDEKIKEYFIKLYK